MQEIGSDLNTFWAAINEDLQVNFKASVTLGTLEWKFCYTTLVRKNSLRDGSIHIRRL